MALASDRSAGVVSPPGTARLACVRCNGERESEREGTIELKGREIGSWFATFATCYASSSLEIWIKLGFQLFFWGSKTGENKGRG